MLKRSCVLLLLVPVLACSGSESETASPAAPSPAAPSTRSTFTLSGQVITSGTRVPISEATVSVINGSDAGRSAITDTAGNFNFTEMQQSSVIVDVSAAEYFSTRAPVASNQIQTIFLVPFGPVIQLSGRVTDANTSTPIAAATVYINGRYHSTTNASGHYSLTGHLDIGASSIVWASADGFETHTRYIRGTSAQSFRLRRVERIVAGQSWSVTVRPDDSLCFTDFYDPSFGNPGSGFLCRTVRVVAQRDGVIRIEAVSTGDGSHPPLDVTVLNNSGPWDQQNENPASMNVRAGTELAVSVVGMPEDANTSQSFIVTTSMSP
jgi:Carboxypeptidase regulatory-like domain